MWTLNQRQAQEISDALKQYAPETPLTDSEFDALSRYIAVTREMREEPFFSEDWKDTIVEYPGDKKRFGRFGHPAFLKSAMLPFRKLWLVSEPCKFEKVRDFIDVKYGRMKLDDYLLLEGHMAHYYGFHESLLNKLAPENLRIGPVSKIEDIIELWIHTLGVHTGKDRMMQQQGLREDLSFRILTQ